MREIKFRGKRLGSDEWVSGGYWKTKDGDTFILRDNKFVFDCEVDPATVGQYTGLKDRENIEIYEGEIIDNDELKGAVEYCDDQGSFIVRWGKHNEKLSFNNILYIHIGIGAVSVGNIHDSPDLLEKP